MSLSRAKEISQFLQVHEISYANIMGGEVWCHPQWEQTLETLVTNIKTVRIPTNGDWSRDSDLAENVVRFLKKHPQCYLAISNDPYHTNTYINKACAICEDHNIKCVLQEEWDEQCIMPMGRSKFEIGGLYSTFSCYCHNPETMYSFFIDEDGAVYRCSFGVWQYTYVDLHLDGSFFDEFRRIGRAHNKIFIGNCKMCMRAWRHALAKEGGKLSGQIKLFSQI